MNRAASRTLVLVRHGRADGNDPRLPDFARRLDPRGRAEAVSLGRRLRAGGLVAPCVMASPALRTLETAQLIIELLDDRPSALETPPELYLAGMGVLAERVRATSPDAHTLVVVGHNPGISDFAGWLSPALEHPSFGTGEALIATLPLASWTELTRGAATDVTREPGATQ